MTGRIVKLDEGLARIRTGWRVSYFGNDLWAVHRNGWGPLFNDLSRARRYYVNTVMRRLQIDGDNAA